MLESHCSNRSRCRRRRRGNRHSRSGEFCDAIAIFGQDSNTTYRLIEAKSDGSLAHARSQLQKGADYLDPLATDAQDRFTAEVHAKAGPKVTARAQKYVLIRSRGERVPVQILWQD